MFEHSGKGSLACFISLQHITIYEITIPSQDWCTVFSGSFFFFVTKYVLLTTEEPWGQNVYSTILIIWHVLLLCIENYDSLYKADF